MTDNDLGHVLDGTGFAFAHYSWSHAPSGDYGVYGADSGNEFATGDGIAEQVLTGLIDYFTRDNSGAPQIAIQSALKGAGIIARLEAVQYEHDTGYIHYTWRYYFGG